MCNIHVVVCDWSLVTVPCCRSEEEEDERAWNPHYAARKAHNEAMRSEANQRDAIRAMFLKVWRTCRMLHKQNER